MLDTLKPQLDITCRSAAAFERDAARELIRRVHYQEGQVDGEFILAFAEVGAIKVLEPEFVPNCNSGTLCLVGAAVLKRGMTHGNPKGRRDLAERRFPELKVERLRRNEIVDKMGLALISRVAVEPNLHGYGVGRALAQECRRQATSLVPGSRYVEVMTSQRLRDAQRLIKKENAASDFLQAAGFRLAPIFTRIKQPRRDGRDRRLYYWASIIR